MKSETEIKFLALLRKSPKSKEEVEEVQRLGVLFSEELSKEIKDLIVELKGVGLTISSIWDMVNTKESYPEAIGILIEHIPKHYHDKNREGIFRALAVKEAKGSANEALIREYNKIPKEKNTLRWVIGNAMYILITPKDIERILPIVQDKKNGMSRHRFVLALGKMKSEKAEDVLIKLLDDDEMTLYALQALERMRSKKAKGKIALLTNNPSPAIKKEAQKALKKL